MTPVLSFIHLIEYVVLSCFLLLSVKEISVNDTV